MQAELTLAKPLRGTLMLPSLVSEGLLQSACCCVVRNRHSLIGSQCMACNPGVYYSNFSVPAKALTAVLKSMNFVEKTDFYAYK